jgi:hypothetical protein
MKQPMKATCFFNQTGAELLEIILDSLTVFIIKEKTAG